MMSDAITRLNAALEGSYRIERQLGEGGMATVYLARDQKHDRSVALKVLKPELAAVVGGDRFLAEIETTANLQHPHILPLFDSGEADGFLFYVMPFVEGETLRERLDREAQLPVDEAVRIASDVAEALDYAHARGVIHRDIKPANILVHAGRPLIADFGIALALGAGAGTRLTETGLSVGTPHYMSPEQATGDQHVGVAADVYALGCVLYEMLVGEPPFTGSTAQAILGKIIVGRLTPVGELRTAVPRHVGSAVAKALEKMPADRFESAEDLARALGDPSFRWPLDTAREPRRSWQIAFAAAASVAVASTLLLVTRGMAPTTEQGLAPGPSATSFHLPEGQLLDLQSDPSLVFSPDGSLIVYAGARGGETRLYVRELASYEIRELEGTEGAQGPFFAPDGRSLGFFVGAELRRLPIEGGIPTRVAEVAYPPEGASWGDDGTIVFARSTSLWRVPASGGAPVEIPLVLDTAGLAPGVPVPANLRSTRWPHLLPGADHALAASTWDPANTVGVVELGTGRFRPLIEGDRPNYLPSGHIVYYSGPETVSLVPFDLERLEITGPPVPIVDDALRPAGSRGRFAVSGSGTLAYPPGGYERQLVIVDRNGRETPVGAGARGYRFPEVSPDGRVVVVTVSPQNDLWTVDLERETAQPFTDAYDLDKSWSPDGTRLAFFRNGVGVVWVPWPAGGEPTLIAEGGGPIEWATDDEIFLRPNPGPDSWDLTLVDVQTGEATEWLATPAVEEHPAVSPDRAWVAYESEATGARQIYVRALTGDPRAIPVSTSGGAEPQWSEDGSELFYRNGNAIMAVPVRTDPSFEVTGPAEVLFDEPYDFINDHNWDVMPGDRFLMIRSGPNVGREVRIMTGWLERLAGG